MMRHCTSVVGFVIALALFAGCATTKVTAQTPMVAQGLQRPNRVWVYDFIADPAKVPASSSIATHVTPPTMEPTVEDLERGSRLGALIAQDLTAEIQGMGLTALQAGPGTAPQPGDAVIRGYLISMESGSAAKRFVIGFGSGGSEMDAVVEGYTVTPQGWHKLGSGNLSSSGNKTPGMVVPSAVAIATGSPIGVIVMGGAKIYGEASGKNTLEGRARATSEAISEQLKIRFQERGWIS